MPSKQTLVISSGSLVLAALLALGVQGALGAQATLAQTKPATPAAKAAPAQPKAQAPAQAQGPAQPSIDPKAVAILRAACATLSSARTMSFTVVDTYEHAARNGQPLYYSVKSEVVMQRPNRLRVVKVGDGVPDEFYYDGKTVMAFVPSANVVAVADAPPTVDEMLDSAWDYAAIHFPFADVLVSNPCDVFQGPKSAFYVGQSKVVGGVTTDMVAVSLGDAQGELWIGADDHLPRMIRTNYPNEPAQARYQSEYSNWRINAPVDPATFTSQRAAAAQRIAFQPPSAAEAQATPPRPNARRPRPPPKSGGTQ